MPERTVDITLDQAYGSEGEKFVTSLQQNPTMWADIPLLNYTPLPALKDLSVVRFRGMVQDMKDPEVYLERYEVLQRDGSTRIQEGKYRDCYVLNEGEKVNHDSEANVQSERRPLFLVSIPGLNDWAKEYEAACNYNHAGASTSSSTNERKRHAELGNMESMEVDEAAANSETNKRVRTGDKMEDGETMEETTVAKNKRNLEVLSADYHVNSPIRARPGKACIVKLYSGFDDYPLNTVIDVVGFLSSDPCLDMFNMECEDFADMSEMQAQNPPPHIVPRMHAIFVHKMPHLNPLLDERLLPVEGNPDAEGFVMEEVRNELHQLLTRVLFNDEMAADYLLSHLLSSVYNRTDTETVGQFALNLYNLPVNEFPEYTKKLYNVLELLLPASHFVPLKTDLGNNERFIPKKDYKTEKLLAGLLQLAPHTHLVLDEKDIKSATLSIEAAKSMQCLRLMMRNQQLKCDFEYYEIDYDCDVPMLTLSETRSSLPHASWVPVQLEDNAVMHILETFNEVHNALLEPGRLDRFRRFLTKAKKCDFILNEAESEMVQNDFVTMRKADKIKSVDQFHVLMVLSRLLSIARGNASLDSESWELAKRMEEMCEERRKALKTPTVRLAII